MNLDQLKNELLDAYLSGDSLKMLIVANRGMYQFSLEDRKEVIKELSESLGIKVKDFFKNSLT